MKATLKRLKRNRRTRAISMSLLKLFSSFWSSILDHRYENSIQQQQRTKRKRINLNKFYYRKRERRQNSYISNKKTLFLFSSQTCQHDDELIVAMTIIVIVSNRIQMNRKVYQQQQQKNYEKLSSFLSFYLHMSKNKYRFKVEKKNHIKIEQKKTEHIYCKN